MQKEISILGAKPITVSLSRGETYSRLQLGSMILEVAFARTGEEWEIAIDGLTTKVVTVVDKDIVLIHAFGRTWRLAVVDPAERKLQSSNQSDVAKAPMPGLTISVMVKSGDTVAANATLVIIESMKMQVEILASRAGTVDQVHARVGETFPLGATLVTLVPLEPAVG